MITGEYNKKFSKFLLLIILGVFLICALFPIYWMINTSVKNDSEINRVSASFIPEKPTIAGYKKLHQDKFSMHSEIVYLCHYLLRQ